MLHFWGHLHTICHHKALVARHCFAVGLYRQGLTHDLSKFAPVEFVPGIKYFRGYRSPNEIERMDKGYSAAWLHHKGRNRHHLEYWIDYSPEPGHQMCGMRMPEKYVAEMICDRIAASKTYQKDKYTDAHPWEYYQHSKDHYLLHPETRAQLEQALRVLRDEGEAACFAHIRTRLLGKKR